MPIDLTLAENVATSAYERGRLVAGVRRALIGAALVAMASFLVTDAIAWLWLPLTAAVVGLGEWRGEWPMKAMRRGFALGLVTAFLPMTILRPCCSPEAMARGVACCTTPSACWAAGAAVGIVIALAMPRVPATRRFETILAGAAGALSVAVVRCSTLVIGEAIGLLGGISIATIAIGVARAKIVDRRAA